MNVYQQAAIYADLGYPVFPCVPDGKRPLPDNGLKSATTDAEQIEAWEKQWPRANLAIRTDCLLVIDIDPLAEGGANPWLASEHDRLLDLAAAPMSLTPRGGRHYWFRQPSGGRYRNTAGKLAPHVDTRADGGYVLVAPSAVNGRAYRWVSGSLDDRKDNLPLPPVWLIDALEDRQASASSERTQVAVAANTIPSGQRNAALTSLAGVMRRVGMGEDEIAAALLTANAQRCVPALDDVEVRKIAHSVASYPPDQIDTARHEYWAAQEIEDNGNKSSDPGPFPSHLLNVPGFIGRVIEHNLAGAIKPQPVLALGAALSLLATLTGRKVRDEYGTRTNLYCLGVARTGTGKERARLVNKEILFESGLQKLAGPESVASSAGLVSAVEDQPAVLFQWDEIGRLLRTMGDARDAPHLFNIGTVLMKLYTSAGTVYLSEAYADRQKNKAINQPHACLYGTTVPRSFYESLTKESITDGFLSRMMIFESDDDPRGQSVPQNKIPADILEVCRFWGDKKAGNGNLADQHPEPHIVEYTADGEAVIESLNEVAYQERRGSEEEIAALWTRTVEKARKLAILWACSQNHVQPRVSDSAALWACELSDYLTRKMLFVSRSWVAENQQESKQQRLLRLIAQKTPPGVKQSDLCRRTRFLTKREREELIESLRAAGDITVETVTSLQGRPATIYRAL